MFDGVDVTIVATPAPETALRLYTAQLGFTPIATRTLPAAARHAWSLPGADHAIVHLLSKPGSSGGWICLLDDPTAPLVTGPRSIGSAGPYALDFYVRRFDQLTHALARDGWSFRSPVQRYQLFGTGVAVRERLLEAPQGLVHAIVDYQPRQHRCVLSARPDDLVSEVAAVVLVVDEVDAAAQIITEALGARCYYSDSFHGPAVETLLGLPPGTSFRMALFRGPQSRNARLELIERQAAVPVSGSGPAAPTVVLSCGVQDLQRRVARLRDAGHDVCGPFSFDTGWGSAGRVSLRTSLPVVIELFERG